MGMKSKFGIITLVLMLVGILFPLSIPAYAQDSEPILRPMIFVHGGAGSGAQFESQAMRFTSNGYPANYIAVHEYDSSSWWNTTYQEIVLAGLDQLIDTIREDTDADKVDLLGHSLGTAVCQGYLNYFPGGAAKVAHYVNIDGFPAGAPPGGVSTLAIWGMGKTTAWNITGAFNVYFFDQSHVQVCTSAESFVEMYKFFTGKEPVTKYILPEPPCEVKLAGRAVIFPQNVWVGTANLEIWEVNGDTGARIHTTPEEIYSISEDGAWGPFNARGGVHYEFVLLREGMAPHHHYREPFIRSNYWIRLLTSLPGGIADYADRSDRHSNLLILRYKEFWGQGVNKDILAINGVNVVTAATCPITKLVNGIWVYDKDADGESNLTAPIDYYFAQPFQTGVDLYIPAAIPPNGTISIVSTTRGMPAGASAVINVPNWASSTDRISVQFNDYFQDVRMLIGFGGLRIDCNWNFGKTIVYIIDATVIDFRVDGVRVAWNIVDHRIYEKLEVYKGESELGWIKILITKGFSTAYGPNVFFLGLLV